MKAPRDKVVGFIYETTDYSKFKTIRGNRNVDHDKKIISSIKRVGRILSPILVNGEYEIIDGQNRFKALKFMGFPIQYMVQEGIGLNECIALNIGQSNWNIMNYVKSYAEQENENYKNLLGSIGKYTTLDIAEIMSAYKGSIPEGSKLSKTIKDGELVYEKPDVDEERILRWAESIKPKLKRSNFPSKAMQTLIVLNRRGLIDPVRMEEQFEKYGDKFDDVSPSYLVESLERFYNFGRKKRASFAVDFRNMGKAKIGRDINKKVQRKTVGVIRIDAFGNKKTYKSVAEAANDVGVSNSTISRCINGMTKMAAGYMWERADK